MKNFEPIIEPFIPLILIDFNPDQNGVTYLIEPIMVKFIMKKVEHIIEHLMSLFMMDSESHTYLVGNGMNLSSNHSTPDGH